MVPARLDDRPDGRATDRTDFVNCMFPWLTALERIPRNSDLITEGYACAPSLCTMQLLSFARVKILLSINS